MRTRGSTEANKCGGGVMSVFIILLSVTAREGPDLFTEDEDERRSWLATIVYLCSHTLPLVSR